MSNPFLQAGGVPDKQSKFAPLYVNQFWTGLYTNRNPLREGAVPYLYQKFYSGSRFESILGGQNIEITSRLTPARRPGNSVYNSATFPAINTFYPFHVFDPTTFTERIILVADTAATVYNATGPSTQTALFSKATGSSQTSFQSSGNTLYAADGISTWKWVWAPAWIAANNYVVGTAVLDGNNNLQQAQGLALNVSSTSIATSGGVTSITVNYSGTATVTVGDSWTFKGMTANPFLNGQTIVVLTTGSNTFTALYSGSSYSTLVDTGMIVNTAATGVSGVGIPSFGSTIGAVVVDNTMGWVCRGPSVQTWGIVAPVTAPLVSNIIIPSGSAWAASTYYWPTNEAIILDSNGRIQKLTTDGTLAGSVPTWATSTNATTTDGTAVWTCKGTATRATGTFYAVGSWIAVTISTTVKYIIGYTNDDIGRQQSSRGPQRSPQPIYGFKTITTLCFFQASVAGTSSATTTANISWPSGLGGTIKDGTVTWLNVGYQVTRTASATSSPTAAVAGNVGNSQAVTAVGTISDIVGSSGGTGFVQNVTKAGASGVAHPTWAVTGGVESAGLVTTEASGLQWTNGGPSGSANTGSWVYTYSFENSVTGHESTAAPLSIPIVLAANSGISLSGAGDPNFATDGVDTVNIYRSTQGETTPFLLTQIQLPASGAPWSFVDIIPDPPNPGSSLNEFIEADTTGVNSPPPANITNLTFYLDRIWASAGEFVYYSGVATQAVGVGAESFPGLQFFQMPSTCTKSWPSPAGLLLFLVHGVYFTQGVDGNLNPNSPIRILEDVSLLSSNLFTVNGSIATIFTSDKQMVVLDPSAGVSRMSDPIADQLASFSATASYVTWHTNGIDQAYFIADGSTGWFRLAPTSAPENGATWSVKANIVSGVKCVQSVETSPGVRNLLLGPVSSGPILKRDYSTFQDNGSSYLANFTIGSIVLAQPGQCAEVQYITTEALATGSHPTVSILGDEVSGLFEALQVAVNDPPFLNTPSSLYPDRWYFSQLQQPAWLRHLQIQFSWPAENFANELLSFALSGCIHIEG